MNPTGICKLCRDQNVTLIDSHVVSKWVYRRILGYDPTAAANLVGVYDGRAGFSSEQVTEYLLCKRCEDLLGIRENYASQIALQKDSATFPALEQSATIETAENLELVNVKALDVDALTHFAVSVFWRADLAQIDPIVDLGAAREPLRQYLLSNSPFPASANIVLTLIKPAPSYARIDRLVSFPGTTESPTHGHQVHLFLVCGMRFTLYTGTTTPPPLEQFSLPRAKLAFVSNGRSLLDSLAEETQTSSLYGKLASKAQ